MEGEPVIALGAESTLSLDLLRLINPYYQGLQLHALSHPCTPSPNEAFRKASTPLLCSKEQSL